MSDMRLPTNITPQVRESTAPKNPITKPIANNNMSSESFTTNSTQAQQDKYDSSTPQASSENPPVDERINFGGAIAAIAGAFLAIASGTNVDLSPVQDQLNKTGDFISRKGTSYELGLLGNAQENAQERFARMSKDANKKPENENP